MRFRLFAFWVALIAQAQSPPSPGIPVQGEYQNRSGYAFRITIPNGLIGYRVAAPAPSHGIIVNLGSSADRLSISGFYNAFEHSTPRAALRPGVDSLKIRTASWTEPQYNNATLGGLPATEVVVKYVEKTTAVARLFRSIAALRRSVPTGTTEILYEITLDTAAGRTEQDTAVYYAIRKSFRLDPLHISPKDE